MKGIVIYLYQKNFNKEVVEYSDIKGEMRKQEILHSLVERKELLMDINM